VGLPALANRWQADDLSESTTLEVPTESAGHDMQKINLSEKLAQFDEYWHPRIVGELNGQHVKLAKMDGAFVWHHHVQADELFLVLAGRLRMQFRDGDVVLEPGECLIVPRGVEHRPEAVGGEAHVLLFEPAGTVNTGNVRDARTIDRPPRL
jgi:mannose-6-phosphate isomerase-like protein (cupin superfamily)